MVENKALEAVEFTDKGFTVVNLKPQTTYLIDGEVVAIGYGNTKVEVSNVEDIRLVTINTITRRYTNGIDILSPEEYVTKRHGLYSKYDENDCTWDSLEDEFEYRKFLEVWQPVRETVQNISYPIKVDIVKTAYDSGNPYIVNAYLTSGGTKKPNMFTYHRQGAINKIVSDYFTSLGMVRSEGKLDYYETANKKVWSNSNHSGVRYLVAFGGYVFTDEWKEASNMLGTLEDCIKWYEQDKRKLEATIYRQYIEHFGKFNEVTFDYKKLLTVLNGIDKQANTLDVKKASYNDFLVLKRKIGEALELLRNHLEG